VEAEAAVGAKAAAEGEAEAWELELAGASLVTHPDGYVLWQVRGQEPRGGERDGMITRGMPKQHSASTLRFK
jgi:hypothetical protein